MLSTESRDQLFDRSLDTVVFIGTVNVGWYSILNKYLFAIESVSTFYSQSIYFQLLLMLYDDRIDPKNKYIWWPLLINNSAVVESCLFSHMIQPGRSKINSNRTISLGIGEREKEK